MLVERCWSPRHRLGRSPCSKSIGRTEISQKKLASYPPIGIIHTNHQRGLFMSHPASPESSLHDQLTLALIAGIGPRLRAALLAEFTTPRRVLTASPTDLSRVPGVDPVPRSPQPRLLAPSGAEKLTRKSGTGPQHETAKSKDRSRPQNYNLAERSLVSRSRIDSNVFNVARPIQWDSSYRYSTQSSRRCRVMCVATRSLEQMSVLRPPANRHHT